MVEELVRALIEQEDISDAEAEKFGRLVGRLFEQLSTQVVDTPLMSSSEVGSHPSGRTSLPLQGPSLGRYLDRGLIGFGGMGEVRRVLDPDLGRVVAMKIVRSDRVVSESVLKRFAAEARATARLEHPAIVPVHELGRLPDGRWYFTMKEIKGVTLGKAIREVHVEAIASGHWGEGSLNGRSLAALVDVWRRACEAVAYAHERGVLHRDLKPTNIMLGPWSEVLVVDWGLVKLIGQGPASVDDAEWLEGGHTDSPGYQTRIGQIAGTPAYMPPEQAMGAAEGIGPTADVYALGAILYEILCGQPPYVARHPQQTVARVLHGPPTPISEMLKAARPPPVPEDLLDLVRLAMARKVEERPPNAGVLAREIARWQDGARRRERALTCVQEADALAAEVAQLESRVEALGVEAQALLSEVPIHAASNEKSRGWGLQDLAEGLAQAARLKELDYIRTLRMALNHDPELPEAHLRLADHYKDLQSEAEAQRDHATAAAAEVLLRAHHQGRYEAWLKGDGRLTLITDPPGARVQVARYGLIERRMVPGEFRDLGVTPLVDIPLEMGSYLVELSLKGHREVRCPVVIDRQGRWNTQVSDEAAPTAIVMPPEHALGVDARRP